MEIGVIDALTHIQKLAHTHTLNATSMFALVYVFDLVPMLRFYPKCCFEDPLPPTTFLLLQKVNKFGTT